MEWEYQVITERCLVHILERYVVACLDDEELVQREIFLLEDHLALLELSDLALRGKHLDLVRLFLLEQVNVKKEYDHAVYNLFPLLLEQLQERIFLDFEEHQVVGMAAPLGMALALDIEERLCELITNDDRVPWKKHLLANTTARYVLVGELAHVCSIGGSNGLEHTLP